MNKTPLRSKGLSFTKGMRDYQRFTKLCVCIFSVPSEMYQQESLQKTTCFTEFLGGKDLRESFHIISGNSEGVLWNTV